MLFPCQECPFCYDGLTQVPLPSESPPGRTLLFLWGSVAFCLPLLFGQYRAQHRSSAELPSPYPRQVSMLLGVPFPFPNWARNPSSSLRFDKVGCIGLLHDNRSIALGLRPVYSVPGCVTLAADIPSLNLTLSPWPVHLSELFGRSNE